MRGGGSRVLVRQRNRRAHVKVGKTLSFLDVDPDSPTLRAPQQRRDASLVPGPRSRREHQRGDRRLVRDRRGGPVRVKRPVRQQRERPEQRSGGSRRRRKARLGDAAAVGVGVFFLLLRVLVVLVVLAHSGFAQQRRRRRRRDGARGGGGVESFELVAQPRRLPRRLQRQPHASRVRFGVRGGGVHEGVPVWTQRPRVVRADRAVHEEFLPEGGADRLDDWPVPGGESLVKRPANLLLAGQRDPQGGRLTDEKADALRGARDRGAREHGAARGRLRVAPEELVHDGEIIRREGSRHALRPRGLGPRERGREGSPSPPQPRGFARGRVRAVPALRRAVGAEKRRSIGGYAVHAPDVLPDGAPGVAAADHVVPPVVLRGAALARDPLEFLRGRSRAGDFVHLAGKGSGVRRVVVPDILVVVIVVFEKVHVFLVKDDEVIDTLLVFRRALRPRRVLVGAPNLPELRLLAPQLLVELRDVLPPNLGFQSASAGDARARSLLELGRLGSRSGSRLLPRRRLVVTARELPRILRNSRELSPQPLSAPRRRGTGASVCRLVFSVFSVFSVGKRRASPPKPTRSRRLGLVRRGRNDRHRRRGLDVVLGRRVRRL
mmetsp:Transcript_9331/g.42297  ORF Transcript_9331/g.42297 Transcript_9331/m.42297 type:complete len:606 (+) Transcript_9331:2876-4693(+)